LNRQGPTDTDFINGTWYLRITDVFNSNENPKPFQNLDSWGMNFTSGLSTTSFGADTTAVIGSFEGVLPESITGLGAATLEVPAVGAGQGLGAALSVAMDNTLGSFSPFQGRMYMVYTVGGRLAGNNPTYHDTDIGMSVSDDGG